MTGNWNAWEGARIEQATNDAFVRGDLTPLSTKVAGLVREVSVSDYQTVRKGAALVQLEAEGEERWIFLAPAAGGRRLQLTAASVDVLTPEAPLGRALIGRCEGDEVTLRTAGKARAYVIVSVRYLALSPSRWNNVSEALTRRDWDLDDDGAGATVRYPPGRSPNPR